MPFKRNASTSFNRVAKVFVPETVDSNSVPCQTKTKDFEML